MSANSPEQLERPQLRQEPEPVHIGLVLPTVLAEIEDKKIFLDLRTQLHSPIVPEILERQGYARQMPQFRAQVLEVDRDMPFRFKKYDNSYDTITEHEALTNFWNSINEFLDVTEKPKRVGTFDLEDVERLREDAYSILDNMNFVGQTEYEEATAGIAARWKAYLAADPKNVLCLDPGVSTLPRFQQKYADQNRKSDDWFMEDALLAFSDEEFKAYNDRIVGPDYPHFDPAHTKVVLMDDWSISGTQLRDAFAELAAKPNMQPLIEAGCVEINLLVASSSQLENGLDTTYKSDQINVPIISYFRGHDTSVVDAPNNHAHISGAHSSVNYGFRDLIRDMMKVKSIVENHGRKGEKIMLPLLHIEGMYKDPKIRSIFTFVRGKLIKKGRYNDTVTEHASDHNGGQSW